MSPVSGETQGERIVRVGSDPHASPAELAAAAQGLELLAHHSFEDAAAYREYHGALYALDETRDPRTEAQRRWLASRAYTVEEQLIPHVPHEVALPPDEFLALVRELGGPKQRVTHPLSRFLYEEAPTLEHVKLYIRHNWFRSNRFYTLLTDLAGRVSLETAKPLYRNLYDELGCHAPDELPHPELLRRLMEYLGLPCGPEEREWLPEQQAYLNNRVRCMRSAAVEWGWAVCFCLECITATNHAQIHRLLQRAQVPEELSLFYRLHSTLDFEHTREIEAVVLRIATVEAQRTFLRSVSYFQQLGRAAFDAIWREMQNELSS